jgi:hypothetical protein
MPSADTQFKKGGASRHQLVDGADNFATLVSTLSSVGGHVKILQDRCEEQRLELIELERQNVIFRSESRKARDELSAVLRAKDAPVALETDEVWLFQRNATLKFGMSADGRRILVMRCRGDKIVRMRDKISEPGQVTALLKAALATGRSRANARLRGNTLTKKDRLRVKKRAADALAVEVENQKLKEVHRGGEGQRKEESPNEALARRQDRLADAGP